MKKEVSERTMRSFIKTHLPDHGVFGTADLFREKFDVKPETTIAPWAGHPVMYNRDYKVNEQFCNLLDKVTSSVDDLHDGVYDPVYVVRALRAVKVTKK